MNIAFLTTQSAVQSTIIGRVLPLAKEFQKMGHDVTILLHREKELSSRDPGDLPAGQAGVDAGSGAGMTANAIALRITGTNPFSRSENGKKRHSGLYLIWTMKINAWRAAWALISERPDVIVLVKPLPENTLAAYIAKIFLWNTKVILDVDDFELFANNLSSLIERAAIHTSERAATALASHIVVATPFLYDHIHQMVAGKKNVVVIPTGLSVIPAPAVGINSKTILYIGSTSVSSGHRVDLLPEILATVRKTIPDAVLHIAGSGDDDGKLKEAFHARRLDDAVVYLGRFSAEDAADLAARVSIIIDPVDSSIVSRAKSSFRTALALATGTAVVTSNIGIRTELIPPQLHEKFFALPENASSYAEKVSALLVRPLSEDEKHSMQKKSEEYTWEHLAVVYYKLFV